MQKFVRAFFVPAATALAVLGLSGAGRAQTLAQYTFDAGANSTLSAATVAANTTASTIDATGAANVTPNLAGTNTFGYGTGYVYQLTVNSATVNNAAAAVAQNTYFQFTVAPTTGYSLSLTNLSFLAGRGGGATPRGYVVRSSADGFAANLGTGTVDTARPIASTYNVALALTGLTSATTFRIYTYTPSSGQSIEYDNITLSGAATLVSGSAAPEPSSFALVLLPLAGVAAINLRGRRAV